jgi:hypothetical protein
MTSAKGLLQQNRHTAAVNQGALCPQLARADIMAEKANAPFDPKWSQAGLKSRSAAVCSHIEAVRTAAHDRLRPSDRFGHLTR